MTLHPDFLTRPLTHRGLHGNTSGCPENSESAFSAAIIAGYGIECDLQLSADGQAMVFHDYELDRLTFETGPVRQRTAAELGQIRLRGWTDTIPTLDQVLTLVAGRAPLLIEIKDQDGALGTDVGPLEAATAEALKGYDGPVAVMSFNPHAVAAFANAAPGVPVGLVTDPFHPEDWPLVPRARLEELATIPDYDRLGAAFISHNVDDLGSAHVARLKAAGAKVFCWTVRSAAQAEQARKVADNITFEGFRPPSRL